MLLIRPMVAMPIHWAASEIVVVVVVVVVVVLEGVVGVGVGVVVVLENSSCHVVE
jgi:hypothetical protein